MILEGVTTTMGPDDEPHLAPMGATLDDSMTSLVLRPFHTSVTYRNLMARGEGVFHITDDVELIAQSAIGRLQGAPELIPARSVRGFILADACRWYAFRIREKVPGDDRSVMYCQVIDHGWQRDFVGFHRARHAVLEFAILATRVHLLRQEAVLAEMERWRPLVEKTGGPREVRAWQLLEAFVQQAYDAAHPTIRFEGGEDTISRVTS